MNFSEIVVELFSHAKSSGNNECCGLVIIHKGKLKYIKCTNLLNGDFFCISPEEYARCEDLGEIVAICHSHVNYSSNPSEQDILACNNSNLPWIIVSLLDNSHTITYPTKYIPPLVGRKFYHGVQDCYSLIRDYYNQELNINLSDYFRVPNWWDYNEYNLYEENFMKEGFTIVNDLKLHDVLLIQNSCDKVNHAAIYVGNSTILHHCGNRLSSRDVYGGYWRKNTRYIIRHKDLYD